MGFTLNPLTLNRKVWEFLGEKPKHQWTIGSLFSDKNLVTWKFNRAGRLAERGFMIGWGIAAVAAALPMLPIVGPLGVATMLIGPLINIKLNALALGGIVHGVTWGGKFLAQSFDQIFNGPDEFRAQKMPKMGKSPKPAPQPSAEPSPLDRMIALGQAFNGRAGQPNNNALNGATIWGDPTPPQPQSTTNTYEQAFTVPTPEQIRIASSGGESVAMHDLKLHLPQPAHHQEPPPPPPPVYKPPGCDN